MRDCEYGRRYGGPDGAGGRDDEGGRGGGTGPVLTRRGLITGALLAAGTAVAGPAAEAEAVGTRHRTHHVRATRLAAPDGSLAMTRISRANRHGDILGSGPVGPGEEGTIVWTRHGRLVAPPLPPLNQYTPYNGASGLNDRGQLAGSYAGTDGKQHGLVWDRYDAAPREVTFGRTNTSAAEVNNHGQIAGVAWDWYTNDGPVATSYFYDGGRATRIVLSPDTAVRNGVAGLNDRGTVLVRYGGTEGELRTGAFLWRDGETVADLNQLAKDDGLRFTALNAFDEVVLGHDQWGELRLCLYTGGAVIDVPGPTDGRASIRDVRRPLSDLGHIAGNFPQEGLATRPFLWHLGRCLDLGTLGGESAEAVAVNNLGEVAGTSDTPDGTRRAFLWRRGELIPLPPPGAGYDETSAAWLTDQGDVLGYARTTDGDSHAFRWTVRWAGGGHVRFLALDQRGGP